MERFERIDDCECIIKNKKGVFSQRPLYHRLGFVYVGIGSGFVAIRHWTLERDAFLTSDKDIKVIAMDKFDHHHEKIGGTDHLRYGKKGK